MSTPPPAAKPLIIVIGSGLAGLTASLSALLSSPGVTVHVLDRAPKPGGNSIKASSGISAAGTRFQPQPDSPDIFYADTIRSAGARLAASPPRRREARERLVRLLTDRSASAVDFLSDELGVDLGAVAQLGGHSVPRTHRGGGKKAPPPGAAIITSLLSKLRSSYGDKDGERGRFVLSTGAEVTRLLTTPSHSSSSSSSSPNASSNGAPTVTGVEYTDPTSPNVPPKTLLGPVIFAAGGFAGDATGLLARYRPDLAGLPSTNEARPAAHDLLAGAGAEMVDMDSVQVHPTGFVDPQTPGARVKFLAAEMLRGEGGILVDQGGKRFVNELETREVVSRRIMGGMDPVVVKGEGEGEGEGGSLRQWDVRLLLDAGAAEAAGGHVGFYLFKGLLVKVKVRELDEATRGTLEEYAKVVSGEKKDEFGRTSFGHWRLGVDGEIDPEAEVCVGRVTPITHFTMGGALINENARVLASGGVDGDEQPIDGLWAAGEITGGIHGDNRLGGSSLLECVVFGRIAGQEAAKAALAV
ncbi:Flavocytochrome c [Coniochaeta hoffmannii]|uniref:Flavocytochrome c n=1 Tax=Coniochaeta hoffmannii TaxID=91930 RepID=A0AA38RBD9_9PEZI|nr:Flavocytochrome c [Coniochaeta hoffmannii]